MPDCNTNSTDANCVCPSFATKEIIQANQFGLGNPKQTRYFCSHNRGSCLRYGPGHRTCECSRSGTYKDCHCSSPGTKYYVPADSVPGLYRDYIYCCGNPALGESYNQVCRTAGFSTSPPSITSTITPVNKTTIPSQTKIDDPVITTPAVVSPPQPTSPAPTTTSSTPQRATTTTAEVIQADSLPTETEPTTSNSTSKMVSNNGGTLPVSSEPAEVDPVVKEPETSIQETTTTEEEKQQNIKMTVAIAAGSVAGISLLLIILWLLFRRR